MIFRPFPHSYRAIPALFWLLVWPLALIPTSRAQAGNPSSLNYVCVSRDNDGRGPYVFGYKDIANVVRISGTVLNTLEECESGLANARLSEDYLFACVSRDGDGLKPYAFVGLYGANPVLRLRHSNLGNAESCLSSIRSMQVHPEGLVYCGSRDNDGLPPYVRVTYRFTGTYQMGSGEYFTLGECQGAP